MLEYAPYLLLLCSDCSWYGSFHRSVGAVWIVNGTAPSSNYVGDFFNLAFSGGWSMPSLVERDIAPTLCPPGWTYYQDNGTEGVDSCLYIPQSNQSSWLHSVSACPVGSHLLSIRSQSRVSGLLPFATSLTPLASFIGCYQDSMTQKWFWLDGTSAANLNHTGCSGITCPIWSSISILYVVHLTSSYHN